jgi:hypothetical protein
MSAATKLMLVSQAGDENEHSSPQSVDFGYEQVAPEMSAFFRWQRFWRSFSSRFQLR